MSIREQKMLFESGNELAAFAAKQINYHVMGYYPITPSTQIAEYLDEMKANGEHTVSLVAAEGEHSAAGICYGASAGGGRVFNATSANGLLYAIEQLPVQSGTRLPMVMNVACRTVSGPLSIKGDHSDIMFALNSGWIILFANSAQEVYDYNICAVKIAEKLSLPVIVAFDGFFTSHQKRNCLVFSSDEDVLEFVGKPKKDLLALDPYNPVTVGSYMNEPDIINNKYQLHLAMNDAKGVIQEVFSEFENISGRKNSIIKGYKTEDAEVLMFVLGSAYFTAVSAAEKLREKGKNVGVFSLSALRPFFDNEIAELCKNAKTVIAMDRQDSYGAGGGNMSLELRASLQKNLVNVKVISRVFGLGGKDFFEKDAIELFEEAFNQNATAFSYVGISRGSDEYNGTALFNPVVENKCEKLVSVTLGEDNKLSVSGATVKNTVMREKRIAPGHGACPGCGIPVNLNLLLRGIEGNVVLLFQTGCAMVVTTAYPKTAFKVPYVHNLFQNGAATLSGLSEMFFERQRRGEMPKGDITFIMVSGDGGMDIGMGSALGAALRRDKIIIFEYDNGGYMNTGYQLSYSTPKGAKSSTSHIGKEGGGKTFFHKDTPQIMAATHIPYVATAAESDPNDFIKKAAKAQYYAQNVGTAYIKCLSACPLNWGDRAKNERKVIEAAVNSCYFPLYEVENGVTSLSFDPKTKNKKIPVKEWFSMMGRTKHLAKPEFEGIVNDIQVEIDRRFNRLKELSQNPML